MHVALLLAVGAAVLATVLWVARSGNGYGVMAWVSAAMLRHARFVDRPVFDTDTLQWATLLRDNHHVILDEYQSYSRNGYTPKNSEVDPVAQPLTSSVASWRVLILRLFYRDTAVARHFPRTCALLAHMPHTAPFVMFSVLEPGAGLAPHKGYYKGVLRYHLGLSVPSICHDSPVDIDAATCTTTADGGTSHASSDSSGVRGSGSFCTVAGDRAVDALGRPLCALRVAAHTHIWRAGRDLLFDDCYTHEVRNLTAEPRVVLLLDVPRRFSGRWAPLWHAVNHAVLRLARVNDMSHTFYRNIQRHARRTKLAPSSTAAPASSASAGTSTAAAS